MQRNGAMRVENALGLAGGAGGVAHGGSLVFGEVGVVGLACICQKGFVRLSARRLASAAVLDYENAFEMNLRAELLEDVEQNVVYDEKAVLGVVDDVGDLFRIQAQVQGVHDGAHCG